MSTAVRSENTSAHAPSPLYAVVGNPVAHSRSPAIHAIFSAQTGVPMQYERLLCPADGLEEGLRQFALRARGCNITVPFKAQAFALAGQATERARLAQAANTLRFDAADPSAWVADNTDGAGLVRDIEHNAGLKLLGSRVLLIGAGGAAAGALGPLLAARPCELTLCNRTESKAQALAETHQAWARVHGVKLQAHALTELVGHWDIVINASASSLSGADVPVSSKVLRPGSLALDMMYGPAAQGFLGWAQSHGALARDGLGMLVEQASEAWLLWKGVRPETQEALRSLRQQLTEAHSS